MFEKIRPLGDRVLLKRVDAETKTESGIILPDSAKEKAQVGRVIAVGSGKKDPATGKVTPVDVAVDALVYFGKYAGTEADKGYVIVREDEILGIIEK